MHGQQKCGSAVALLAFRPASRWRCCRHRLHLAGLRTCRSPCLLPPDRPMPVLLLALDRGASVVLNGGTETCVLGRGGLTRLKHPQLSRSAATCTAQERAGEQTALSVTAARRLAVVRRGSGPAASPQLLEAGQSAALQDGDCLYLLPSADGLRFGYRVVSLPSSGSSGAGSGGGPPAVPPQLPTVEAQPAAPAPSSPAAEANGADSPPPPPAEEAAAATAAAAAEAREARAAATAAAEARIAAAAATGQCWRGAATGAASWSSAWLQCAESAAGTSASPSRRHCCNRRL